MESAKLRKRVPTNTDLTEDETAIDSPRTGGNDLAASGFGDV
jgi:hypothetical protein